MNKKKALICISQAGVPSLDGPQAGATMANRVKALGYDLEPVNFTPAWLRKQRDADRIKCRSLYFLAARLRIMSRVDAVAFAPDWADHRSTRILHSIAEAYGLEIIDGKEG